MELHKKMFSLILLMIFYFRIESFTLDYNYCNYIFKYSLLLSDFADPKNGWAGDYLLLYTHSII